MPRSCSSGVLEDDDVAGVPMPRRGCSPGARWPSTLVGAPSILVGSACAVCGGAASSATVSGSVPTVRASACVFSRPPAIRPPVAPSIVRLEMLLIGRLLVSR